MDTKTFSEQLNRLVKLYQPNREVHDRLSGITMIPVVGPTGVGKTTLIKNSGIPLAVSDATRDPRPGEIHGVDNFFRKDFDAIIKEIKNGEFVQIAIGSEGDFKGTIMSRYPSSGPVAAPITAVAVPNFYNLGFESVVPVFVVPPTFKEWERRMQARKASESPELFANRMIEARQSFATALADDRYQFIISDDMQQARDDFLAAISWTYPPGQSRTARNVAQKISRQLSAS